MSTEILLTFAVLGVTILLFVKEWLQRLQVIIDEAFGRSKTD